MIFGSSQPRRNPKKRQVNLHEQLSELQHQHVRRLQSSANLRHREQIVLGVDSIVDRNPIAVHTSALKPPSLVIGGTQTGKSTLLTSIFEQQIQQTRLAIKYGGEPRSFVIIDLKPCNAMFHSLKEACEKDDGETAPLPFRWFDISDYATPSFLYNPFSSQFFKDLTALEKATFLYQALGLHKGDAYGPSFFGGSQQFVLYRQMLFAPRELAMPRIRSFRDLVPFSYMDADYLSSSIHVTQRDVDAARQAFHTCSLLGVRPELQASRESPYGITDQAVFDNQIDVAQCLEPGNFQVIYARLKFGLDNRFSKAIATSVLNGLLYAAPKIPNKNPVSVLLDEAHAMAEEHSLNGMLVQSTSAGISLMLSTQSLSQYEEDTREVLLNSTNVRIFVDIDSKTDLEAARLLTGKTTEYQTTYNNATTYDAFGLYAGFSNAHTYVPAEVEILTDDDKKSINNEKAKVFVSVKSDSEKSFTKFNGGIMQFYRAFPNSLEKHERLAEHTPVPHASGTFVPSDYPELLADPDPTQTAGPETGSSPKRKRRKKKKAIDREVPNNLIDELLDAIDADDSNEADEKQ